MKTDLMTSIGAAIAGIVIAYFVTNMFLGEPKAVTFKTVDPKLSINLVEPNENVFNSHALNPTVEVYVGDCDEYDELGQCIEINRNEPAPENP